MPDEVIITAADNGRTVHVPADATLRVELEDFGGAGYRWDLDPASRGIELRSSSLRPYGDAVGGGGLRTLSVVPCEDRAEIHLKLWRPTVGESSVDDRFHLIIVRDRPA